jgi:hypothetical protein
MLVIKIEFLKLKLTEIFENKNQRIGTKKTPATNRTTFN